MNKWGVWDSNYGPAYIVHYPLPNELSSWDKMNDYLVAVYVDQIKGL